ncbi:aminotransferase class I/II-fold pyridoxal phosphate-dependent enzyme [Mycobacterium vicinigordonae]|uniref:Aminotransferase class I/II-fold pyridoxal phosphate-dependent enzyme n=2 Tax=Mycobacterium vicinigordonae TaxID=1719132 RepID=A0A7D6HXT9_9MYCO|nr:aminotransferase class I/II-fold pyridoxal phosphate-dependent enzyme [Mycobacterium vicinigordonae]
MACNVPGAADVKSFWQMLMAAESAFDTVPRDRWDHEPFFDPAGRTPNSAYSDVMATVSGIQEFDPLPFGISPRQAEVMDPQHRILLTATRAALDDAGLGDRQLASRKVGVYVGISASDFRELMTAPLRVRQFAGGAFGAGTDTDLDCLAEAVPPVRAFTMPGSLLNMAAAAISRSFNLRGPSMAMDAACASSLVALYSAAVALRAGQCDTAVVAGVHVNLVPDGLILFSKIGAVSKTGVCAPFDSSADGFVLGEGVGVVVLTRQDAVPENAEVYAWLRGVGCTTDGAGAGVMEPQVDGQCAAVQAALADSGLAAADVDYIEAHGTATVVGDAVEVESLSACLPPRQESPRYLGSAKANVGHAMSAAGVIGLIKAVLVLRHGVVPPHPHLREERPELRLGDRGIVIPREPLRLPDFDRPHVAAVSAFGFGGTNVHALLQAEPVAASAATTSYIVPVRGRNVDEVAFRCQCLLRDLEDDDADLAGVAATLTRRAERGAELLAVATSVAGLRSQLRKALSVLRSERPVPHEIGEALWYRDTEPDAQALQLCFLFGGQGSQKVSDAATLRNSDPEFSRVVEELAGCAECPGLLEAMYPAEPDAGSAAALAETQRCQPALLVTQLALAGQLQAAGIDPDVVLGHSVGEFAAAAVAGVVTPQAAVRFAARRGQAIAEADIPRGGMLACRADEATVREALEGNSSVWIVNVNSPEQTVVAGTADGIARAAKRLGLAQVAHKELDVSHPFHSPLLAPANARIAEHVDALVLQDPRAAFFSCLHGRRYTDANDIRQSWREHALLSVRFADAIGAVGATRTVFVEIGAGTTLLNLVRDSGVPRERLVPAGDFGADPRHAANLLLARLRALGVRVALPGPGKRRGALLSALPLPAKTLWPLKNGRDDAAASVSVVTSESADGAAADSANPFPAARTELATDTKDTVVQELIALWREQTAVIAKHLEGTGTGTGTGSAAAQAPVRAAHASSSADVLATIAEIGSYDVSDLAPEQLLVGDLGFDSLMLTALLNKLRGQHPDLAVQEFNPADLTVATVLAWAGDRQVSAAAAAADRKPPAVARQHGIAEFPEWQALSTRLSAFRDAGIENPYWTLHERVVNDTTQIGDRVLVNYSSYNYLGLSGDPRVSRSAQQAIERYGTSVSASRLLSGEKPLHRELEAAIARLIGVADAVTLVGGHSTNVTAIGHLLGEADIVLPDALAHDSIMQGCHLSGAVRRPFRHNDAGHLRELLSNVRDRYRRALVVIEGAYSMDGDIADLPAFIEVAKEHDAMLMVDEAHSIGVLGAGGGGVSEYFGVDRSQVDIWMGTLSKSLSSCGGYLAGSGELVEYLRYSLPGFVYSCGLPPASAAAALASIEILAAEPERVAALHANADYMRSAFTFHGLSFGLSKDTPIVPFVVGDSARCLALASRLREAGINVDPIMYPAVPDDEARLRFFVTASHSFEQIDSTVAALAREYRNLSDRAIA